MMAMSTDEMQEQDQQQPLDQQFAAFRDDYEEIKKQVGRVIVGQHAIIDATLTALFAGGHVLLESVPGLGKTLLARTLADALDLDFRRLQFTPDLMPADVIGTYIVMESHGRRKFEFQQGPIFANILLADEVNRATPKTQSALLEGLGEGAVTVANETYDLPDPFFTIATQSQSETEGTFPLPQTQLDRFFFKLRMPFPNGDELSEILDRTTEPMVPVAKKVLDARRVREMMDVVRRVTIAPEVRQYAISRLLATHPEQPQATPMVQKFVAQGCSPRGGQAMILAGKIRALLDGRVHVAEEDLRVAAVPALRHRLTLNFEGHAEQIEPDDVLHEVLAAGAAGEAA
jgi:MoxR-like ATPase